jgi:hypothetical protein
MESMRTAKQLAAMGIQVIKMHEAGRKALYYHTADPDNALRWEQGLIDGHFYKMLNYWRLGVGRGHYVLLGNWEKSTLYDGRSGTIVCENRWEKALELMRIVTDAEAAEYEDMTFWRRAEMSNREHAEFMALLDYYACCDEIPVLFGLQREKDGLLSGGSKIVN